MKWITHIVWATLAYTQVMPLEKAIVAASVATALTDIFGHTGLRRNSLHDILAIAFHAAAPALLVQPTPQVFLWALVAGFSHLFLDYIAPGKLAVSWIYNLPWLVAGLYILHLWVQSPH